MKNKNIFMYGLAALFTTGFMLLCYIVFIRSIPEPNHDLANILLSQFAAIELMIANYFFGSSKGSADKTELLNNSTPNTPIP